MKHNIEMHVEGIWTLVLEVGLSDWIIQAGLEKGLYRINWNTMKIIDTKTKKAVGRILTSEPNLTIKVVGVNEVKTIYER